MVGAFWQNVRSAPALAVLVAAGLLGCSGKGPGRSPEPRPSQPAASGIADAADAGGPFSREPPGLLLRAAELSYDRQDRDTGRRLLDLALARIADQSGRPAPLTVTLAHGLADPDYPELPAAEAAIAPSGERAAVGHGKLLSVVELDGDHRIHRLAAHPALLRRVVSDRTGRRIATLAEDGVVRLFSVDGEPGFSWPLQSPRAREQPAQLALEQAYRAAWLDFSPDARHLFLADCGTASFGDCPLRRLRVYATDSGELLHTYTAGEKELLDYTARRDGTVAVLFAGEPPRLYREDTGAELPLAVALLSAASRRCLSPGVPPAPGARAMVVSASRRWLANLADPATLCLWDLRERRLAAASALPWTGKASPQLLSLLADDVAYTLVLTAAEPASDPRPEPVALVDPNTGRRLSALPAELTGVSTVMPLDDGGALFSGRSPVQRGVRGLRLFRLYRELRLVPLLAAELPSLSCQTAFPDAVRGDGGQALFSTVGARTDACATSSPVLIDLTTSRVRVHPLPQLGREPILAADFIDDQRFALVDTAANLWVLRGTQVEYAVSARASAPENKVPPSARPDAGAPRLHPVPGGTIVLSADGHFELLGTIERPEDYLVCRAGSYAVPFSLCAQRLQSSGLRATATAP